MPVDDLIFEYPHDFDPVSVTESTVMEVVEVLTMLDMWQVNKKNNSK